MENYGNLPIIGKVRQSMFFFCWVEVKVLESRPQNPESLLYTVRGMCCQSHFCCMGPCRNSMEFSILDEKGHAIDDAALEKRWTHCAKECCSYGHLYHLRFP